MSELKALQLKLTETPTRSVKELIADGFQERQWIRDQKRQARRAHAKAYKARKRAEAAKQLAKAAGGKS